MSSSSKVKLPFNEVPFTSTQIKVRRELLERYEDILEQENRFIPPSKVSIYIYVQRFKKLLSR